MNDPEFRQMVKKAIFVVLIVLVFTIPVFFIFKNKILYKESKLLKEITTSKTVLLYITENNCSKCKKLKETLDENNVDYKEVNKDKEKDYDKMLEKLELNNIYAPTIIYIEKGEVISYMVDIESKEYLKEYLNNYK